MKKMTVTGFMLCACLFAGIAGGLPHSPPPVSARQAADSEPGPGKFLVAKRSLGDPNFAQTVVYLVAHGDAGSLGLIVNRASDVSLSEAAPDFPKQQADAYSLFFGGPVGIPMILVLGRGESVVDDMMHVADGVHISSERPVMEAALAAAASPDNLRFYVGYAGWAAGQLRFELERDSWHVVNAGPDAVFSADSASLWRSMIDKLEPIGIQVKSRYRDRGGFPVVRGHGKMRRFATTCAEVSVRLEHYRDRRW